MQKVYYSKFFFIIFLCFISCKEEENPFGTYHVYQNIRKTDLGYIQYYIPPNYLFFSEVNLEDLSDSIIVRIKFHQTYKIDAILEVERNTNQELLPEGYLSLKFFKNSDELISKAYTINIISESQILASEKIFVNFYPKELYLINNNIAPGYLIIQKYDRTEIPYITNPHDSWKTKTPSEEDIAFANNEWGHLIENITDPFEQAKVIQKSIIKKLEDFQGTPSTELGRLKPFDQYRRLIDGNDKLWCSNWAQIYSHALACFGFTVRQVIFGNFYKTYGEPNILLAEGHTTLEVFDSNNFSWKAIDLTFYLLEAYYQNYPLNILDLYFMINNPMYREKIELLEYDPLLDREYRIKMVDSKYSEFYFNYYKLNQRFKFIKL